MSISANEPRLRSSWIEFLKLSLPHRKVTRGTAKTGEASLSLVESVSAWAAETPNAPAVTMGAESLSYAQLDAQSTALARHLKDLGVKSGSLVALFLERSPQFAIAALAAWKAGAAYLPLDPSSPAERIRIILDDARAAIVIHNGEAANIALSDDREAQVDISDRGTLLATDSAGPIPFLTPASDLAYVIYTSGSTGRPKGVEITHGNLLNLVCWHQSAFAVSNSDRATMLASPGFDAAVWEIWPYLAAGAKLYVPPETTRTSPRSLRDWMVANRVTLSFVPTPIAQRLIFLDWPTETALRFLLTGADVLQQYPPPGLPFTLVNNYGPTECTVVALSTPVTSHQRPATLPPVGRPILNTEIFLLDEDMQPVPKGVIGELYIAGAGVGRGYLRDPDLTTERFVPNPFNKNPDSRLYRTGDLARTLPDGNFEFLGRTDDQIKIRGYRIEPNEVSAALCKHNAVQAGIVVAIKDATGTMLLVAYVVLEPDAQVNGAHLRKHLQGHLPDYMIPNVFVRLDAFPLTANGKVDRAALPLPDATNSLKNSGTASETTPTERELLKIVSPLLRVDHINPSDNFFLLGGHSLLGAQLLAEIQRVFHIDLPLRTVFDYPTITAISSEIDRVIAPTMESERTEHLDPLDGNNRDIEPSVR